MAQGQSAADVALPVSDTDGGCGNSARPQELQNIRLVVDTIDGNTVEIALKGHLQIVKNPPQAGGAPGQGHAMEREAQSVEDAYLDKMRGWLLTAATLFVGMAFQAATQPPGWLPKPKDWFDALSGKVGARDITKRQALLALSYLFVNTVTFSTALSLVVVLLIMGHKSKRGRTMLAFARIFGFLLALSVSCTFTIGISDDTRVRRLVSGILAAYASVVLFFWIKGIPYVMDRPRHLPSLFRFLLRRLQ